MKNLESKHKNGQPYFRAQKWPQCGRKCGRPVSLLSRAVSLENKKTLDTLSFQGFCVGGDKRDRTADLLNAMAAGHGQYEYY